MTVQELSRDERLALVALLKLVVRADRELSLGEVRELTKVKGEMGVEGWKETVEEASRRFRSQEDVARFAETITRPEAQRLIYRLLVRAAKPDKIVPQEASALLWLAKLWGIGKVSPRPPEG